MSTDILEDILDGIKYHPSINRRYAHYNICDLIKLGQAECKGALLSNRKMGKGLQKVFKAAINEI